MTELGGLLRQLRMARATPSRRTYGPVPRIRPMSQNELADRVGVDPAVVNKVERGRVGARRETLLRIASVLEASQLDTARLLVAAGYWPFEDLSDDATDAALAVLLAIASGDWRVLGSSDARAGERVAR